MDLLESHLRESLQRHEPLRLASNDHTRWASVAALVRFVPSAEVLLIRRTDKPDDRWSGHMAFPGGRVEDGDADLVATATRETHEEIGLDLARHGELIGRLGDVQAIAKGRALDLIIVPHVFIVRGDPPLRTDPDEVAEALWAPLGPMLSGATATVLPYVLAGKQLDLPAFRVGPHIVWGLTYRMLELFFDAVRA